MPDGRSPDPTPAREAIPCATKARPRSTTPRGRTLPLRTAILRELLELSARRVTPRRAWAWAGFGVAFVALRGMVRAARALDDTLWPDVAAQPVTAPVFIYANARSGTTMLHRLMSMDEDRFAPFMLYQSIFSAVSLQRLIQLLARLDEPMFRGALRGGVDWINGKFFSGWEGIHKLGIDEAEEDEMTFVFGLYSPTVSLAFPFAEQQRDLSRLDDLPEAERQAFMDFYEDTLKRHLYASGQGRTFINKNVFFMPRVRAMYERFPDARFIYMVRHPYQALPSFLDMFHQKWVTHSPQVACDSPESRALAELAFDYYRYAMECQRDLPEENFLVVRYEDLVADPKATVERVYREFGWEISPAFEARLRQVKESQRDYKSEHTYTLEQFGLTKGRVYDELSELFEQFGYER